MYKKISIHEMSPMMNLLTLIKDKSTFPDLLKLSSIIQLVSHENYS